jgi:hypothetical protein
VGFDIDWLTNGIGDPVPLTVIFTVAVPPTVTGKVLAVVVRVKDWLVAATVKFTVVFSVVLPLVPATVMA